MNDRSAPAREDPGSRRALVTGASSGIGASIARALAADGYQVALLARREDLLHALLRDLPHSARGEHLALSCDLLQPAQIEAACTRIGARFGALDLVVNSAGIGYRAKVEELDYGALRRVLDTNVAALLMVCKATLPLLRKGCAPVVVNVASVVGRRGVPGQSVYTASKAAVVSIGEALRVEWAREGISVCTLNPALTATGFFAAQANPAGLRDPDLAHAMSPEQVARAVLELDRHPRPEWTLRQKWWLLALASLVAPRWSDRLLARRLGGGWQAPR